MDPDPKRFKPYNDQNANDRSFQVDPRLTGAEMVSPNSTRSSIGNSFQYPAQPGVAQENGFNGFAVSAESQLGQNASAANDPKRSRACESCRSLKVKCEPDNVNPDASCRRCAKAQRECVFTVPTRKRQKRTDSRVAELERKIDKLTATLQHQRHAPGESLMEMSDSSGTDEEPEYLIPPKHSNVDSHHGENDSLQQSRSKRPRLMHKNSSTTRRSSSDREVGFDRLANEARPIYTAPSYANSTSRTQNFHVPKHSKRSSIPTPETDNGSIMSPGQGTDYLDVVDRKLVTMDMATKMFNYYNDNLIVHFPAVTFSKGTTAEDVRKTKPFLFLAILAASSGVFNPDLSRVLNKEVIRGIADKVIVNGEKSLEIIQVIIVATLWYFPPEVFEELKFYQLTHLATVMAIDIGLNKSGKFGPARVPFLSGAGQECGGQFSKLHQMITSNGTEKEKSNGGFGNFLPKEFGQMRKQWLPDPGTLESRRTYISCYFMCSNVAMSLRRPNLLRYSAYMGECVEFIESSPEATNHDKIICQWVKLQRVTEEVGIAFGYEDAVSRVNLSETRIQFALKGFERQLEEWQKNLPSCAETKTVRLASHTLSLFMHEVAIHGDHAADDFRTPFSEASYTKLTDPLKTNLELTQSHIDALYTCLSSAHGLLDGFLAFTVDELRCVPVMFFARVAYAVVLLIKLFFSASASKSELGKLIDKTQLKLDYYFERLLSLLKATAVDDKSRPASKFLLILSMLNHWYQYQQRNSSATKAPSERRMSNAVPASPNVRQEQLRQRDGSAYPSSPGFPYRNPDFGTQILTPHSTSREAPQPNAAEKAMEMENAPTPLHMLSDVATTADDPQNNMMNIDSMSFANLQGKDGNFGAYTTAPPLDESWLSGALGLDMGSWAFGDVGFGMGFDMNFNSFNGLGDQAQGMDSMFTDNSGGNTNANYFDTWQPN